MSRKHKDGKRVKYNSGFYITTNVFPDFGHQTDNEAIDKRLAIFKTKSLTKRSSSVASKYLSYRGILSYFGYVEVFFFSKVIETY